MDDTEYKAEYDKAAAELEAAAQATTARGPDGKFTKAQPEQAEPVKEAVKEPVAEPVKEAVEPAKEPVKEEKPDPLAELQARVEKAEKMALDNQRAFTKASQEAAQLRREREQQEREAKKPAILDANPELADAIRFVANDPAPQRQQEDKQEQWRRVVDAAHPGIFALPDDDELVKALVAKRSATWEDPLVAIREITEEKLAHTERQVGKRFAAESAKLAQKSAMSVPGAGAGSGVMAPVDTQLAEVQRINNMSDSDFQKEVRRVKGY